MADIVLSNGREVAFDLTRITMRQYRALFRPGSPVEDDDKAIAAVCGLTLDEYLDLPFPDWRLLNKAFIEKCARPVGDDPK